MPSTVPRTISTRINSDRHDAAWETARGFARIVKSKRLLRTGVLEMDRPRDALAIGRYLGRKLDDWQIRAITAPEHNLICAVTRQGGKGEVATLLALDGIVNHDSYTVVIVSKTDRQARRLLGRIKAYYNRLDYVPEPERRTQDTLVLPNGSEVLALPGSEETIRGIDAVDLLIVDEAAVVDDGLYYAVQPMTATTDGKICLFSSARGKRGFFYREWVEGGPDWHRELVDWTQIPRFKPGYIERMRRSMGDFMFRQEFGCEFLDDVTQIYSTEAVARAVSDQAEALVLPRLSA